MKEDPWKKERQHRKIVKKERIPKVIAVINKELEKKRQQQERKRNEKESCYERN